MEQAVVIVTKLDNGRIVIRSEGDARLGDVADGIVELLDALLAGRADAPGSIIELIQKMEIERELDFVNEFRRAKEEYLRCGI